MEAFLILTDTGSALSSAIKVFSGQPYNHISLAFDAGLKEVYSFGRRKPDNPLIGGFVQEDVTSDFFRNATCQIYAIQITEKEYRHLKSLVQMFEGEANKYHYNFAGLITAYLGIEWARERHFFCSEFVGGCLQSAGILQLDIPPSLVYPQQIVNALDAQLLFEGLMANYLGLPVPLPYVLRMLRMIG